MRQLVNRIERLYQAARKHPVHFEEHLRDELKQTKLELDTAVKKKEQQQDRFRQREKWYGVAKRCIDASYERHHSTCQMVY